MKINSTDSEVAVFEEAEYSLAKKQSAGESMPQQSNNFKESAGRQGPGVKKESNHYSISSIDRIIDSIEKGR